MKYRAADDKRRAADSEHKTVIFIYTYILYSESDVFNKKINIQQVLFECRTADNEY